MNEIWTTREIVAAIIATGIVSAMAGWARDAVKAWLGNRNAARYAAMRSVVALERYAVDCWRIFIMGNGEFDVTQDISSVPLPKLPEFASDIDWKTLDPKLAEEILSFGNTSNVSDALAHYAETWEQNPFEYHDASKERGLEALKLAGRVRSRYHMKRRTDLDRLWRDLAE